jgi:hypothetical protein
VVRLGNDLSQSLICKRDLQQYRFELWVGGLGRFEPRLVSTGLPVGRVVVCERSIHGMVNIPNKGEFLSVNDDF